MLALLIENLGFDGEFCTKNFIFHFIYIYIYFFLAPTIKVYQLLVIKKSKNQDFKISYDGWGNF